MFSAHSASAHCDALDGPVARAVQQALTNGNVNPVLAYAPVTAEAEIRTAFDRSRKVRGLGAEARVLADQAFLETVIRLHRAGEGAPYTGVKPAGIDYGPAIPAADRAVETGDLSLLRSVLVQTLDHALQEKFAHVREAQGQSKEPKSSNEVAAARARVDAELEFITFAEGVFQAMQGKNAQHHED
jgi:hypothetical protein